MPGVGIVSFKSFTTDDFERMASVRHEAPSEDLKAKTEALRVELGEFPEFALEFFRHRLARRPRMKGRQGLVFGPARWYDQHWFLFDVGGDQAQVQLNIGMFPTHIRVGLGFMIGRQVVPKPPAFQVFQTFLGSRPPLPFRNALWETIVANKLRIEIQGEVEPFTDADEIVARLETFHVPPNEDTVFVFLGHIWNPAEAAAKNAFGFRQALGSVMPFYEELILASGNYYFQFA